MTDEDPFEYDVCLSFAGEQRPYVSVVAARLAAAGVRAFYDDYERSTLWGKDLYAHLDRVYRVLSRYCVLFASEDYANKVWTSHERMSAQARALTMKGAEYILPVRFDDTEIPGLRNSTGHIDARTTSPEEVADLFLDKMAGGRRADTAPTPGIRAPAAPTGGNGRLSISALGRIVNEMLTVDEFADATTRHALVSYLPPDIRAAVPYSPLSRPHLVGLLQACSRSAGGRAALVAVMELVLGDRDDVRRLRQVMAEDWPPNPG